MDLVEYPPRSSKGPPVSGSTVDLVNKIFEGSQYQVSYRIAPWPRTFLNASSGNTDLILYVQGASDKKFESSVNLGKIFFRSRVILFYSKKHNPKGIPFDSYSDLEGKLLGTLVNSGLSELYKKIGMRETQGPTLKNLFDRLNLARIDLVSADDISGITTIEQSYKSGHELFGIVPKPLVETDVLLVISRKNPNHKKIRTLINQRMEALIRSGYYEKWLEKMYKYADLPKAIIPYEAYGIPIKK